MKFFAQTGIGLTLLLLLAGIPAGAQNQASSGSQDSAAGSSLGDYARHVRKNSGRSTKPKVFDNDSLPRQDKLSIVGNAPAPGEAPAEAKPEESSTSQNAENKAAGEAKASTGETSDFAKEQSDKEAAWKQWGDKIAQQKNQIDLLSRELDVLQREYQIRAAAMYADVGNRLRNSGDWDKQDAQYKQQIADKEKAVQDAKQKLEDMQEDARKAGVPASIREP
jgi:hypothetical protein